VEASVRDWLQKLGDSVVQALLKVAGDPADSATPFAQMREQLQGFPEVHWAAVPFSLIRARNADRQTDLDVTELSDAMRPFFSGNGEPGFLARDAWQVLCKDIAWSDNTTFFAPNPGVLYPAVHDLAERALAAAKALRPFAQSEQKGWRCSLSGETEWLTTDRDQLSLPAGQRNDTLWTRIAKQKPAWAKKGEHLGALPAIKRLWPTLFAREVGQALKKDIGRFVVSTHTMAMAHQLDQWLERGGLTAPGTEEALRKADSAALPRRLMLRHAKNPALDDARRLPAMLDRADELDSEAGQNHASRLVRQTLAQGRDGKAQDIALETYYSLLLMDGDRMGAWLAGESSEGRDYAISYRDSFHPQVQTGFDQHAEKQARIKQYGQQKRALSPNRHLAISGALNDFSLTVVRHVVENEHLGRLIYAGGDDVFAMLPVADLLPAMQRLRHAYSGVDPEHEGGRDKRGLTLHNGFALLNGKLMRMMGSKATASCGAVIAHHQAPLSAVRRELTAAEQRAKNEGGRDAFSITIVKRSGGALRLTAKWGEPVKLLQDLRRFLSTDGVSRRAAYHTLQWLDGNELPQPLNQEMLQSLLAYQFARQAQGDARHQAPELVRRLITLTLQQPEGKQIEWLRNFISVAEFLAREVRSTGETA
jgi:CRISPR-associated protein Cmr2